MRAQENRRLRQIEQDPEHSSKCGERFRRMAREGADLIAVLRP